MSTGNSWNTEDSRIYREIAAVAVPDRAEQLATLLTLIPFQRTASFRAVDLGCGEGLLTRAVLDFFPASEVRALDGASEMRAATRHRCDDVQDRLEVEDFDLGALDWLTKVTSPGVVISSLCLHHLTGDGKRTLMKAIQERLTTGGALLVADLVAPVRDESRHLFAAAWDDRTLRQSIDLSGSDDGFRRFRETHWNLYRYPDPVDQPSPLFAQLGWLQQAGFRDVDCYWLDAGHAIYGGYCGSLRAQPEDDRYEAARATVAEVLDTERTESGPD